MTQNCEAKLAVTVSRSDAKKACLRGEIGGETGACGLGGEIWSENGDETRAETEGGVRAWGWE